MKGLKEFLGVLTEDKGLQAEVAKANGETAKIVEIAKSHGYEFTEQDYDDLKMEAVSGGKAGDGQRRDRGDLRYRRIQRLRQRGRVLPRHQGLSDPDQRS